MRDASAVRASSSSAAIWFGARYAACAAASSIASGIPSRRWQMCATTGALSLVRRKAGAASWARATKSCTDS